MLCRKYILLFTVALILVTTSTWGFDIDGRKIPDMWDHRYHQDISGDITVREYLLQETHPRTAFLCPKGFALSRVRIIFFKKKTLTL